MSIMNMTCNNDMTCKRPSNLADVDVEPALGHPANPALGVCRLVEVEEVDKRRLVRDLQVLDGAVALHGGAAQRYYQTDATKQVLDGAVALHGGGAAHTNRYYIDATKQVLLHCNN